MPAINLKDLLPAQSRVEIETEKVAPIKRDKKQTDLLRRETFARLVAQEYVRNGLNFQAAYMTVGGTKVGKGNNVFRSLGDQADTFMAELSRIIDKTDIDREQVLTALWAMFNTSILDFVDDHGNTLPIKELRKLPRVQQIMLTKLDVTSTQEEVRDETGKVMCDDNGSPYLRTIQRVRIEIPEKMVAINQLALLMKWVGPATQVNLQLNVGRMMADADARHTKSQRVYEGITVDVNPE